MAMSFKRARLPKDVMLTCVRWYVAYPLSYRHSKERMSERGVRQPRTPRSHQPRVRHATLPHVPTIR